MEPNRLRAILAAALGLIVMCPVVSRAEEYEFMLGDRVLAAPWSRRRSIKSRCS